MEKNYSASKMPAMVTLEPGPFVLCSCGKSSRQPFCDGTHRGTKFTPVLFKIAEKREAWLCHYKHPQKQPYLDDSQKDHGALINILKS